MFYAVFRHFQKQQPTRISPCVYFLDRHCFAFFSLLAFFLLYPFESQARPRPQYRIPIPSVEKKEPLPTATPNPYSTESKEVSTPKIDQFNFHPVATPEAVVIDEQWYYAKTTMPDFSDTDPANENYVNYCKSIRFSYFESILPQGIFGLATPKAKSEIVQNAFKIGKSNFKNRELLESKIAPKINPANVNKLCKILKSGGMNRIGIACSSDVVTRDLNDTVSPDGNSSSYVLKPTNNFTYLTSTCLLTLARANKDTTLEDILEYGFSRPFIEKASHFLGTDLTPSDAIDYPIYRQKNYETALEELFEHIFDPEKEISQHLGLTLLPHFEFFYKKVE